MTDKPTYKKVAVVQQEHIEPVEPKPEYAIVSTEDGYKFGKICGPELANSLYFGPEKEDVTEYGYVPIERIIARSTNPVMLRMQMGAAQAVERRIRPYWQAMLEAAQKVENMMREEVLKVARGEK